jgi:hypothetical protein
VINDFRVVILIFGLASSSAFSQTNDPAKIIVEKNGNVTSVHVEGQLAPTRDLGCIGLADVKRQYPPPDLHVGVRKCISTGDFDRAGQLFFIAGAFARFDAERVADISARDAGQVLAYQTGQSMTPENALSSRRTRRPGPRILQRCKSSATRRPGSDRPTTYLRT